MTTTPSFNTQPHSTEAERTVIGALLLDPESIVQVVDRLQVGDFYDPVYGNIYESMCELYKSGSVVDFMTVTSKLKDNRKLQDIGGSAFLAELSTAVPTASHINQYANIVREKSKLRQMIAVGQQVTGLGFDEKTPLPDLMDSAEQKLLQLTSVSADHKPLAIGSHNAERYDHYTALLDADESDKHYGIQTGFHDVDSCILGLQPEDVMILAGQTSTGKTAVALEFAQRIVLDQNKTVAFFSLEMRAKQLYDRFYASVLGVMEARLSRGDLEPEEVERMGKAADTLAEAPLFIDEDPDKSLSNLRSKARRQKIENGLDLLIIDYIQLIRVPDFVARQNRTEQLRHISENIKTLARELEVPIIVLSQLSRAPSQRPDKSPQLSDIRDSGSIEQDADFVLMLHRASLYATNPEEDEDRDITDLFLRKNRPHGTLGHFRMRFDVQKNRYFALDTHHAASKPQQVDRVLTAPAL